MSRTEQPSGRPIPRREFIRGSMAILTGISALKSSAAPGRKQRVGPHTDYSPVLERIEQTLPVAMSQRDITGASIALVDGESIVWSKGFGYTNRAQNEKVTGDTLFHVGSISKSFTALGVLYAAGKGLLTLDDPVKKHLPWFSVNSRFGSAAADGITIRHLLSHHSGLGTWSPLGNPSDPQYHTRTFEQVVKSVRESWLKFPAGERFEYSNQGIDLAGYALEVTSGMPFAEFMRQELLTPLGMTASTFHQQQATQLQTSAVGYLGKRRVPVVNGIVLPLIAAGGLFASANDLAKFIIFHLQGDAGLGKRLVPARLLQEMYAPQYTAEHEASGYGLGIYKAIQHDTVRFSHGGLGYGISAHYRFLPEHRIGVVLLTNQDTAHNAPDLAGRVIESMLEVKLGTVPKNRPFTPAGKPISSPDESDLRRFEGTYLLYDGALFRFKYEKGNLFHVVGKERLKLDRYSSNEFTRGSRRYKFLLTENAQPKGVLIVDPYYDPQTAENSAIYLPINDTPGAPPGPNKSAWPRHAGKYTGTFLGGTSEVRVSLEKGYLYLNDELRLAETGSDFFIAADGEAIIFSDERLSVGNRLYSKKK